MNKTQILSILILAPVFLSFQNCSQVNFSSLPSTAPVNSQSLRTLEPALAVRAIGCIQCHGNVSSNIVTDFGYGNNYYFGRNTGGALYTNGSPYSDHGRNIHTMIIPADKQIFVPRAPLPPEIASDLNLATLADYIKAELALSPDTATQQVKVTEVDAVQINAPSEQDIKNTFQLGESRMKFLKSQRTDLSGLTDFGTYFKNTSVLKCDGDLVVQGPLYLKDLQVQTERGCRIYVIGSVFENGSITYVGSSELRNLQITASRSINFGLGKSTNNDGSYCDSSSTLASGNYGINTIVSRYTTMWTVPSQNLRSAQDPHQFGQDVLNDLAVLETGIGEPVKDAECSGGRQISFEHILLNAPVVMSRYRGDVKGTIIAEFALMSLGQFKFEFDPVFKNVDLLPKLTQANFLDLQH